MHFGRFGTALVLSFVLLLGCAPTLEAEGAPEETSSTGGRPNTSSNVPTQSGNFRHSVDEDGSVVTTVVDAGDYEAWQSLDLDTGRATDDDTLWDVGFQRFHVRTNGGVTGAAGVQVVALPEVSFEDVTVAPGDGWTVDVADGEADGDALPDNVFNDGVDDWYDYDVGTHTLTAQDITYVVASSEGRFFKLQLLDYYDDAGTPAILSFRWSEIDAPVVELPDHPETPSEPSVPAQPDEPAEPAPDETLEVDASNPQVWVYLKAGVGVVEVSQPENDLGWDLALCRTAMRTNSGTSGVGLGGARLGESDVEFAALEAVSTFGFEEDAIFNTGVPGATDTSGSLPLSHWYDYDDATHAVTAGARTYALRTARGDYAKLRFWSWSNGKYELSLDLVERDVSPRTLEVDATSPEVWSYVSLRAGKVVNTNSPESDSLWDLGLQRTSLRTNSGTSGAGQGGAVLLSASSVAEVTDEPAGEFVVDEQLEVTVPEPATYSGNPVLAQWFDFEADSGVVSAKAATVFGMHTSDGGFAVVQIRGYSEGLYTLDIAYAGAGRTDF